MPTVQLTQLTKRFPPDVTAVQDVNLTVADGEFLVVVGPSGSGKSTTLRLIAGLESPTSGSIHFDQRDVTGVPAAERQVGMVFQGENHFPHLNVRDNLTVGLRLRRTPSSRIQQRLHEATETLGLGALLDRWPDDLSGGQRQRVAVGRALVGQAPLCLLDEPLSQVDPTQRSELREAIRALHRQTQATLIYVTHDQAEAMTLGERIAIMNHGRILQVDTPKRIYESPADCFVASFLGSPPMNLFPAQVASQCLAGLATDLEHVALPDGPKVVGIRPERLAPCSDKEIQLRGTIRAIEYLGAEQVLRLEWGQQSFAARIPAETDYGVGETLDLGCDRKDVYLFADDERGAFLGRADSIAPTIS